MDASGPRLDRWLTPSRRRGVEILDAPGVDPALRRRSHRDIALSNRLLGGSRAMARAVREALRDAPSRQLSFLDVGTGSGETLDMAHRVAAAEGARFHTIALDLDERLLHACTAKGQGVCGSALALPIADRAVDVVMCSLLLHHFTGEELHQAVRELDRVARHRIIVHDLRRSWVAAAGLWTLSFPLAFHPVSRHDGVTSVLRGFTAPELARVVEGATGTRPVVQRRLGYRLVASWRPGARRAPTR